MNEVKKGPLSDLGGAFVPAQYLGGGEDELTARDNNRCGTAREYRRLTDTERRALIAGGNRCSDWENVIVADGFDPALVHANEFFGRVRIGRLSRLYLEFHELRLPVGIYNSTIVSCDLGDDVCVRNVAYLAHYLIGNEVILFNIDEMNTTNYAKFGNGIVKDGEEEAVRIWLEVANENAGRKILPFDDMMVADAWLWSAFRDDPELLDRFRGLTESRYERARGRYGEVGDRTVIKSCRIIKDVTVGSHAYIKGANKLKNLTIKSSAEAGSQIGEGVELVNGIVEYGCRVFYGAKAVRFSLRTNACLKYGARLINSVLGDNGTISCCEVLNSLVFPSHEQHHNNSFLCAATLLGQSNLAAGATIGSNHNSRSNDGEIVAGRGFWPGLTVSLKHSSRFASYCLISKGSYPAELDVPLPFALVSNDVRRDRLQIMPAYWFRYNMYAIARNSWKYGARDRRLYRWQQFEYDYLAPDTVEEILDSLVRMESWAGRHFGAVNDEEAIVLGRESFAAGAVPEELPLPPGTLENSRRETVILKAPHGYRAYGEMVHYYGVKTLVSWMADRGIEGPRELVASLDGARRARWRNVGGQLMPEEDVFALLDGVRSGSIGSWESVHTEYERLAQRYPADKARHALASLVAINDTPIEHISDMWPQFAERAVETQRTILRRTRESRAKDHANRFRRMMYRSEAEMEAVLGRLDDNEFIAQTAEDTAAFEAAVAASLRAMAAETPAAS